MLRIDTEITVLVFKPVLTWIRRIRQSDKVHERQRRSTQASASAAATDAADVQRNVHITRAHAIFIR